jgi:hypothetical protein
VYIVPPTEKPKSGKMLPPESQIEFKVPPKKHHRNPYIAGLIPAFEDPDS